jgi:choline dehydrogenase-like flavoprotein
MTDIVIGSGPAGVSAATALLARGRSVLMIDGGVAFRPADAGLKAQLQGSWPANWADDDLHRWTAPQFCTPPGQTRRYGTDAGMERPAATFAASGNVALRASRAEGGLSNLWGAAVLPYRQEDMAGWPVTAAELAPHYKAVARFLPIAGAETSDPMFPALPVTGRALIPPSAQAAGILERLAGQEEALARGGTRITPARQAVNDGCLQCGLCLHGCPYDLIWSARQTLAELRGHHSFSHRSGPPVVAVENHEDGVTLRLADGSAIEAEHAYLGAGVLETARILMASGIAGTMTLRDSRQALVPFLHSWSSPRAPEQRPLTTLPQLFAAINRAEISPYLIHAQTYTWNDHFPRDLIANYGRLPGGGPLLRALARRLVVAQIFLHSEHSDRITLRASADGRLIAEAERNPAGADVMNAAVRHMSRMLRLAGLHALTFARRDGAPGSSFHVGGSLPMARTPRAGQSDTLGRPAGLDRLHVIDASVFPSVPATTITYSVMANAHRIATLLP